MFPVGLNCEKQVWLCTWCDQGPMRTIADNHAMQQFREPIIDLPRWGTVDELAVNHPNGRLEHTDGTEIPHRGIYSAAEIVECHACLWRTDHPHPAVEAGPRGLLVDDPLPREVINGFWDPDGPPLHKNFPCQLPKMSPWITDDEMGRQMQGEPYDQDRDLT